MQTSQRQQLKITLSMSIAYKMHIFDLMSQKEQEQHLRAMDPRCSRSKIWLG